MLRRSQLEKAGGEREREQGREGEREVRRREREGERKRERRQSFENKYNVNIVHVNITFAIKCGMHLISRVDFKMATS